MLGLTLMFCSHTVFKKNVLHKLKVRYVAELPPAPALPAQERFGASSAIQRTISDLESSINR